MTKVIGVIFILTFIEQSLRIYSANVISISLLRFDFNVNLIHFYFVNYVQ